VKIVLDAFPRYYAILDGIKEVYRARERFKELLRRGSVRTIDRNGYPSAPR
jgi:hypothetical protein